MSHFREIQNKSSTKRPNMPSDKIILSANSFDIKIKANKATSKIRSIVNGLFSTKKSENSDQKNH